MRKKEIGLVYNYIYNNRQRLEHELRQKQAYLRYRTIDVVDCFETALLIERLNTFLDVTSNIMQLLKLEDVIENKENDKSILNEL